MGWDRNVVFIKRSFRQKRALQFFQTFSIVVGTRRALVVGGLSPRIFAGARGLVSVSSSLTISGVFRLFPNNLSIFDCGGVELVGSVFDGTFVDGGFSNSVFSTDDSAFLVTDGGRRLLGGLSCDLVSVAPEVVARTEEKLVADVVEEEVEDEMLVTLFVVGGTTFDLFVLKNKLSDWFVKKVWLPKATNNRF